MEYVEITVPVSDGDYALIEVEGRHHPSCPGTGDTPPEPEWFDVNDVRILEVTRWNGLTINVLDLDCGWAKCLYPRVWQEIDKNYEDILGSL